jgi:hypothetical protein
MADVVPLLDLEGDEFSEASAIWLWCVSPIFVESVSFN